jgi:hypothetical protein
VGKMGKPEKKWAKINIRFSATENDTTTYI